MTTNGEVGEEILEILERMKEAPMRSIEFEAKKLIKYGYGSAGYIDEKIGSLERSIRDLERCRDRIQPYFREKDALDRKKETKQ